MWEEKVIILTESMLSKVQQNKQIRERYLQLKKSKEGGKQALVELNLQMKTIRNGLKAEYKHCKLLSRQIMTFFPSLPDPS